MSAKGIGQSVLRKEDGRFMAGRGSYVGDIKPSGLMEVAFARSAIAHGRIRAIEKPAGAEGRVFTSSDLDGVKAMRAPSGVNAAPSTPGQYSINRGARWRTDSMRNR